jgi:hypothetical protein
MTDKQADRFRDLCEKRRELSEKATPDSDSKIKLEFYVSELKIAHFFLELFKEGNGPIAEEIELSQKCLKCTMDLLPDLGETMDKYNKLMKAIYGPPPNLE